MSLNLTGSSFDTPIIGYDNQNVAGLMDANYRAVLYVFKPYGGQFQDVSLRPFNYRFDDNFYSGAQELTDMSRKGTMNMTTLVRDFSGRHNLNDYVMPSFSPEMTLRSSLLTDSWRFILILTDSAQGLVLPNTRLMTANNNLRRIYTGYFMDEPLNKTNFGREPTLNPNAYMVITHKTVVGTTTNSGPQGPITKLSAHTSDEIFNPHAARALISVDHGGIHDGIHLLTPENCVNAIDGTEEGDTIIMPGFNSNLTRWQSSQPVASVLEQPEHNVAHVIRGMMAHQDEMTNNHRMLSRRGAATFESEFLDGNLNRRDFARNMQLQRSPLMSKLDLDVDARISPVDLRNLVAGELDIIPFELERPQFYETADQREMSFNNQYSFLISSVISPILSMAGLNEIEFVYEIANRRGQILPNFHVINAAPNYPVPQTELAQMVRAVEYELVHGIFKTIFSSQGDFHVAVKANATGMTTVRLTLVGAGETPNPVDFELPSCLGGLVSPLLGNAASRNNNSQSIETLFNVTTGQSGITPKYFDDDDIGFMEHAQGLISSD